ncbi:RNA polymerase sigma factor [candidate division KSB1 bacterium]|nr:RNA polymerase sigma factor [candidate division KSB1 bacterium]
MSDDISKAGYANHSHDLNVFRRLVETHQSYAYALAIRLLHNRQDAEDVVQEAFIRIWRHRSRYNPEVKFTTYLYKIVVRLCYDRLRSRKRRRRVIDSEMEVNSACAADDNDEIADIDQQELLQRIHILASALPLKQKLVFCLRDLQGLTIDEVKQVTGLSTAAVKTNLFHARKFLREQLTRRE